MTRLPMLAEARHEYGVELVSWEDLPSASAMVAAVGHRQFKERPTTDFVEKLLPGGVVTDVKCMLDVPSLTAHGISVWRL